MKRFAIAALLAAATFAVAQAEDTKTTDAKTADTKAAATKAPAKTQDQAMLDLEKQAAAVDKSQPGWRQKMTKPAQAKFDPNHKYFVTMVTTKGKVVIRMLPETAPMHVTSFLYLTKAGFYDGLAFHRVIPDFMAQGGCPLGTGTAGPGYQFAGEFPTGGPKHNKGGLLSMANAGPGTDGSQFFLTFVPTPWLDGKHTIFGEVVEGAEVLKELEKVGSPSGKTTEPLKMDKVTVEVK